eukprot:1148696-Pyramimonas_sp.AAC.1
MKSFTYSCDMEGCPILDKVFKCVMSTNLGVARRHCGGQRLEQGHVVLEGAAGRNGTRSAWGIRALVPKVRA